MTITTERPADLHRPPLLRLTRVELRKLVDTRAGAWLLATIGLLNVALVAAMLVWAPAAERTVEALFYVTLLPIGILLPVLGILSITGEWSQRTALGTFTLVPRRERVIVAKLAAVVLTALASVLVSVAVAVLGGLVAAATGTPDVWGLPSLLLWHAVVLQVTGVLMGAGFGLLLLNTPLAIVTYLFLPILWSTLGATIPGLRGPAEWLDTTVTMDPLFGTDVDAGQWGRIGVSLLVWMILPLAAGTLRTLRQEVS
ncbi:ABC transporter permease [Micromonospora sp. SH-82]|uniref:ABC transporter permease n=1 Tax=Micromonospora sp. SH-82 TaxID=3132938 RepID=UPI003EB77D1E